MSRFQIQPAPGLPTSRRDFLWRLGGGLGGIALASMLGEEGLLAGEVAATRSRAMQYPPKAKRIVQLYMSGAASQCDLWDYKPALAKHHGEKFDPGEAVELFQSAPDKVMKSPFGWRQHGNCGKWLSDPVAALGDCVDDIAFIHSMVSKSNVHGPATFMQATGFVLPGFPSMGSWISYGLGSMNNDLPTFVVLPDPRGLAAERPHELVARLSAGRASGHHGAAEFEDTDCRPVSARWLVRYAR